MTAAKGFSLPLGDVDETLGALVEYLAVVPHDASMTAY